MIPLLVILVFLGTFLVAAVAVVIAAAMRKEPVAGNSQVNPLFKQEELSSLPAWHQILGKVNFADYLKVQIEEAGMHWSVGRVTLAMLFLGVLFFAIASNLLNAPAAVCWIAAWLGASTPYFAIQRKRSKRLRQFEAQFPDALDSLVRAMRAGNTLSSGILLLASETPAPLGPEFRKTAEEHRLGLDWAIILDHLSHRAPTREVRLLVAALQIHTRTGGKLTEVLERLSENVRESAALAGEVRALSSQGRFIGLTLTAMPIFIGIAMYLSNPTYVGILFRDPAGKFLLWCAVASAGLGHLAIQRIASIRAPQ